MTLTEAVVGGMTLLAGLGCAGYGVHMGMLGVRSWRRWRGDLRYARELGREPRRFEKARPGSKYIFLDIETSANRSFFLLGTLASPLLIMVGANAVYTAYAIFTEGIK